jgi:hypothetical protein
MTILQWLPLVPQSGLLVSNGWRQPSVSTNML